MADIEDLASNLLTFVDAQVWKASNWPSLPDPEITDSVVPTETIISSDSVAPSFSQPIDRFLKYHFALAPQDIFYNLYPPWLLL